MDPELQPRFYRIEQSPMYVFTNRSSLDEEGNGKSAFLNRTVRGYSPNFPKMRQVITEDNVSRHH